MSTKKPVAKGRGRRPRTRSPAKRSKAAIEADIRLKARLLALEARLSTLHSWVGEIHERLTGESVRAHPDDLEGIAGSEADADEGGAV